MSKTCGTAVEYSTVAFKQGWCFGSSVLKMDGFDHTASFTRAVFDKFIDYIFRDAFPGEERFDKCVISCSDLIYDESDDSEYKRMLSPTLSNYFDAFPTRDLDEFEITSLENDDEFGLVKFTIKYNVFTETKENLTFSGNGQFVLIQEYGWWMIKKVDMPGLEIH